MLFADISCAELFFGAMVVMAILGFMMKVFFQGFAKGLGIWFKYLR